MGNSCYVTELWLKARSGSTVSLSWNCELLQRWAEGTDGKNYFFFLSPLMGGKFPVLDPLVVYQRTHDVTRHHARPVHTDIRLFLHHNSDNGKHSGIHTPPSAWNTLPVLWIRITKRIWIRGSILGNCAPFNAAELIMLICPLHTF